jgi:hypothetical protein
MHRSKLSTFVIDCQTDNLEAAAGFWSAALGRRLPPPQEGDTRYRELEAAPSEPLLMIQRVDHPSRVHLDIESDDIEAEVRRLEALGAKRLEKVRTWVVMQAPTGQRFCVVRPQRGELVLNANRWPSSEALPAFTSGEELAPLLKKAGRYHGRTRTWLEPGKPPDESLEELRVEPMLGGRWVRFEVHGSVLGKAHAGEMTLGYHRDRAQFELSWVDTFHTGSSILFFTGARRADGVIAVGGTYPAGNEVWSWRTEFHLGEKLTVRGYNITPAGEEMLGIETEWEHRRPIG